MSVGERQWRLRDLVVNHQTGKLRETLVWANAGKAALLYAYLKYVTAANYETMTTVMAGALIAHEVIKTKQHQDQQKLDKEPINASPT